MTEPLTPAAALLLRRILVHEDSRLPVIHAPTEAMTTLVDELKERGLVTVVIGALAPLPPVPQPQRRTATTAARRLLTEGVENSDARAWLTALGVPITAPETPSPDPRWTDLIDALPQRTITVEDVLRTAPQATMRGGSTPADEAMYWIDAMVTAGQLTVTGDGVYEFPVPSDQTLTDALDALRVGNFVAPRMKTELVMSGAVTLADYGTVVPETVSEAKTTTETTLADQLLAALGDGPADSVALAKRIGVHYVEAQRELMCLRDEGHLEKVSGSLDWRLPNTAPQTTTTRTVPRASGTTAPKSAPATAPQTTGTATKTPTSPMVSPPVSAPETTAPVTKADLILNEVRAVRRDLRAALAPITAPKTDTSAAQNVLASSDVMTRKVLTRVVVCLHTYGEMPRTNLRKKFNGKRLYSLPEAIALGLRIGALDANARDGKALRLIDHTKVIPDAALETAAAEQRQRDAENAKARLSRWAS